MIQWPTQILKRMDKRYKIVDFLIKNLITNIFFKQIKYSKLMKIKITLFCLDSFFKEFLIFDIWNFLM